MIKDPFTLDTIAVKPNHMSMTALFTAILCIGLATFGYIYGYKFDISSEEQLLFLGPFWVVPIAFGLCGLLGERVVERYRSGLAETIPQATFLFARSSGFLAMLAMFPFLLLPFRTPLKLALGGAAFWLAIYLLVTRAFWHLF